MNPLQLIVLVLLVEVVLYFLASMSPRIKDLLARIGIEPFPLGFLIKRKSGVNLLDRFIGSRSAKAFFTLGIPVMVVSMILFYVFVYLVGIDFVAKYIRVASSGGEPPASPLVPIIPGLTITGWDIVYLLIAIGINVTLHELGHAIAAKAENKRLKSYGAGLLLFFPVAFVELEEEDMLKSEGLVAGRILTGGVLMNMIIFAIASGVVLGIIYSANTVGISQGVIIEDVEKGSLAEKSGISPGLLILSINNTRIGGLGDFLKFREYIVSNGSVYLEIEGIYPNGTRYSATIYKPSNTTRLGIYLSVVPLIFGLSMGALVAVSEHGYVRLYVLEEIIKIFLWISIIGLSLAIINAAPLFITDGGKFLDTVLPRRLSRPLQILTTVGFILIFALSTLNIFS
ncbi:MAG TPA: site-2 protease family protein [Sulfolobales archaeon]|nr:site-2 protease family protein [Sulfolobales archaeon]